MNQQDNHHFGHETSITAFYHQPFFFLRLICDTKIQWKRKLDEDFWWENFSERFVEGTRVKEKERVTRRMLWLSVSWVGNQFKTNQKRMERDRNELNGIPSLQKSNFWGLNLKSL